MHVFENSTFTFTLERQGSSVHALLQFELEAYYSTELGYEFWQGELSSNIGAATAEDKGSFLVPTTLVNDYVATLSTGVKVSGSYDAWDYDHGRGQGKFTVTIFDDAADFVGTSRRDLVFGSVFDDTFRSTIGGDVFEGGAGSDLYLIHHADARVVEAVGGGDADRVAASISYTLSDGAEIEELRTTMSSAATALKLTGNEFAQTIIGNAGNNILDGKGGADVMAGGDGDDIYYVDNAGDTIVEQGGGGQDRVAVVDVSFVLNAGAKVEMLTTDDSKGVLALALTGNEYNQTIIGNAGNNVLDGNGGTDTLIGGLGNDIYYVDSSDDVVIDNASQDTDVLVTRGVDYVLGETAQVERVRTSSASSTADIDLTGNNFAQYITGNAGDNVLAGRGGGDRLYGLGGADTFLFDSALGSTNRDTIYDFGLGDDQIQLDRAVFAALGIGALDASAFKDIAAAPLDASDRIIYNSDNGKLYYDTDGSGGTDMILFAAVYDQFRDPASLTAADFSII